jgi:hypothetical protein
MKLSFLDWRDVDVCCPPAQGIDPNSTWTLRFLIVGLEGCRNR